MTADRVNDSFVLSGADIADLASVDQRMRAVGMSPPELDLHTLLSAWKQLADGINEIDYGGVDDFNPELYLRDELEFVIRESRADLANRLRAWIEPIDDLYWRSTVDDERGLLGVYARVGPEDGWWWRRIPIHGPTRDQLEELGSGA